MKTPEEIKKGLVEAIAVTFWAAKDGDAHDLKDACDVAHTSMKAAMIYIQHLEAERDAAVALIPRECKHCKYDEAYGCELDCLAAPEGCHNGNTRWEWRGVQKEETK